MSFEFPHVILKLFAISADGGIVLNTCVMVVITVVSFCLLLSCAYRSLNVLSHHFNLNSLFHDTGIVMVLCVIMFT